MEVAACQSQRESEREVISMVDKKTRNEKTGTFCDKALAKAVFLDLEGLRREFHFLLLCGIKELNFDAEIRKKEKRWFRREKTKQNKRCAGTNLERSIFK